MEEHLLSVLVDLVKFFELDIISVVHLTAANFSWSAMFVLFLVEAGTESTLE